MTYLRLAKATDGSFLRAAIVGHSGFGIAEGDIVCAAVTAAVRMLETTLNDVLGLSVPVSIDDGTAEIAFNLAGLADRSGLAVLNGFIAFMRQLEDEYPDNIKVVEE